MTYQSLYRKYRPKHLDEVVGQKHILDVLNNTLKKDMISHAYLFCGPRGTGKTSIAKLFAQSINCETPGEVACGHCANCIEGLAGIHPDIVEIDAASNNGVEEIRNLIDRIKYTPILGKYKVYIIDEVHMLSAGAFNAFLKTLEEPPEHAVFVLATTEIHKVIPTIVSRCQRFDFDNLSDTAIKGRLEHILNLEHVSAEDDVTQLIASLSNGALRNALTILEQAIIVADPVITLQQVHDLNGVVTSRQKYSLIQSILGNDMERLNNELTVLLDNAVDVERLVMDLVKTMKDTIVFQYTKNTDHSPYSEQSLIEFLAPRVSTKVLLNMVETLLDYTERMKFSHNQAAYFEIALIKLFNLSNEAPNFQEITSNVGPDVQTTVKLKTDFSKTVVKSSEPIVTSPIKEVMAHTAKDDSMDTPVHILELPIDQPIITHVEREYEENVNDTQTIVAAKETPMESKLPTFNQKASPDVDQSIDLPVHVIPKPLDDVVITHVEREYHDDVEDSIVEKNLTKQSQDTDATQQTLFVSQDEVDQQYDDSLDAYELEDKPLVLFDDNIEKPIAPQGEENINSTREEVSLPVDQGGVVSKLEESTQESSLDTLESLPVQSSSLPEAKTEEKNKVDILEPVLAEPLISEPTDHKIDLDEIVKFMVSANKDLRMIDDVNFKSVSAYINDFEWAKCARLIGSGTLALSGNHFIMITLDDELQVKEVMEPINNIELLKFSTMLFNSEKRIYATTKEEFSKAVVLFRELHATGSLPKPLSEDDISKASTKQVEKERDIKLEKVKELFGNNVNIIS